MTAASDGFMAASEFDIAAMNAAGDRIVQSGRDLNAMTSDYLDAKEACRAAG